jgi:DNA-binding NtrC family response regulator
MMSGHATIDTAVEATKIGALNFLEKPIALQKLLAAVEQGLSRGKEKPRAPVAATAPAATLAGAAPGTAAAGAAATAERADMNGAPARAAEGGGMQFSFDMPLREARDLFERAYFEYHLQREGGSMTRVAEKTGLERTHLYRKLKQLGVELSRNKGEPAA